VVSSLAQEAPPRHSRAVPVLATAAVAAVYVVAQLLLFDTARALEWDEAEYLAEVQSDVSPIGFSAHRSRGISLLVAPIGLIGGSVEAVRIYLALLSGMAMFGSFVVWRRALGSALPYATALFAAAWLVLFYGSEVSPNLWSAYGTVAVTGALAHRINGGRVGLSRIPLLLGAIGLMRPTDAAIVGAGLFIVAAVLLQRRSLQSLLEITAGVVLGWVPWLVEALLRFGGIRARLSAAEAVIQIDGEAGYKQHFALFDGPLIGPESAATVTPVAWLWWSALALFTAFALLGGKRQVRRQVIVVLVPAVFLASFYVLLPSVLAPRFLLPVYGLLVVSATLGLRALSLPRLVVALPACVALLAWSAWNASLAQSIEEQQVSSRAEAAALGALLRESFRGERCSFRSQYAYPQIEFYSGCDGARYVLGSATNGADVLLVRLPPAKHKPPGQWRAEQAAPEGVLSNWYVYRSS
jgi:hypothetical protein